MMHVGDKLCSRSRYCLIGYAFVAICLYSPFTASVTVPHSNCYALDNSSRLVDFTDWIGHVLTHEGQKSVLGKEPTPVELHSLTHKRQEDQRWVDERARKANDGDLVVRFCKDVEFRSQMGYIDFGRFGISNYFVAGSGSIDFIQVLYENVYIFVNAFKPHAFTNTFGRGLEFFFSIAEFYNGDLTKCEHTFDKLGRTAQVNIICGSCLSGGCKGEFGCICNISYDASKCRVVVEIAIPCAKHESRVFEGFTVGFHPRSWEIVYNGLTQIGFEKPHPEFSFETGQSQVPLYLTAISSVAILVGKPSYKVSPKEGLEIRLSGSAASGVAPTTLSPSVLLVNWRCKRIHDSPYKINISIPVDGYDPIEFTLTKFCGYTQGREGDSLRGWATFGVISCVLIVLSVVSCCGGFIYKTRVEHQHGLYALPGMTILSACLDAVSGAGAQRLRDDSNGNSVTQASWERVSTTTEGTRRTNERRYG